MGDLSAPAFAAGGIVCKAVRTLRWCQLIANAAPAIRTTGDCDASVDMTRGKAHARAARLAFRRIPEPGAAVPFLEAQSEQIGSPSIDLAMSRDEGLVAGVVAIAARSTERRRVSERAMLLEICHVTTYDYRQPVQLLAHRMMLCPRGSHALRLVSIDLQCEPASELEWTQDVFGNLIATASFSAPAQRLQITSRMTVEQTAEAWPVFKIAPHAHSYPFSYSDAERTDLGALLVPEYPDPDGRMEAWARAIVLSEPADTLALLQDVNGAARIGIDYVARDAEGTQAPGTTLDLASGTCRDMATLFIEAARHLGFAARAVSGYLFDPPVSNDPESLGNQHGATHAWAEVYLPCAGWIAFDPTNGRMGEAHLVPVAVARNIGQVSPVEGRYVGPPEAFAGMTIDVTVSAARPKATQVEAKAEAAA
jgi:transglutaminase-like putative cysteine protease